MNADLLFRIPPKITEKGEMTGVSDKGGLITSTPVTYRAMIWEYYEQAYGHKVDNSGDITWFPKIYHMITTLRKTTTYSEN